MDDLMKQFFGGGSGGVQFDLFMDDDFDEFISVLESGSDKAFRRMFRQLGKNARGPKRGGKAAYMKSRGPKGSRRGAKEMRQLEEMMSMGMGLGMGFTPGKGGSKKGSKMKEMEEMEEMMMAMMMGEGGPGFMDIDLTGFDGDEDSDRKVAEEFYSMPKDE